MVDFTSYMVWDSNARLALDSIENMENKIRDISDMAKGGMPVSVQVKVNPHTSLLITVGKEVSHLEFYSEEANPLVIGCLGPWDSDELIEFSHMGEFTEMEKRFFVPISDAQVALREYFFTGKRPTNISWNENV